jgi:hypothetical protein
MIIPFFIVNDKLIKRVFCTYLYCIASRNIIFIFLQNILSFNLGRHVNRKILLHQFDLLNVIYYQNYQTSMKCISQLFIFTETCKMKCKKSFNCSCHLSVDLAIFILLNRCRTLGLQNIIMFQMN